RFPLKEKEVGQWKQMKVSDMKFTIRAFEAEGLGHVSAMSAKGFFGLMQMDTLIINPTKKDLPLYSYDRVHAMGNDTLIVELYDTLLGACDLSGLAQVKEQNGDLPDHDLGEHWYDSIKLAESVSKKGKKQQTHRFDILAGMHLAAYLETNPRMAAVDADAKRTKAAVYVDGLLQNGGPSTDVFKKALGDEKTAQLFREVLFGTSV
ncbi:MAG: hypothetical protein IJ327_03990, partial [Lachnospiraceae bacterium]|nr:hypothetical protein [Lachnospiraceae bacterium]